MLGTLSPTCRADAAVIDAPSIIDGQGRTLLAGLIDSHVHADDANSALEQVMGVTTVLDMFSAGERLKTLTRVAAGDPAGLADLHTAGTGATALGGHPTQMARHEIFSRHGASSACGSAAWLSNVNGRPTEHRARSAARLYALTGARRSGISLNALFDAWADRRTRRRWLDGVDAVVRTATAPKSMRLGWPDGTIVAAWFTPKGSKSVVALAHTKLRSKAAAEEAKKLWAARLDALAEVLDKSERGPEGPGRVLQEIKR